LTTEKRAATNRRLAKKRVQCLNESLCFVSSSVLAASLVLRNPLLRQAPKRYIQAGAISISNELWPLDEKLLDAYQKNQPIIQPKNGLSAEYFYGLATGAVLSELIQRAIFNASSFGTCGIAAMGVAYSGQFLG